VKAVSGGTVSEYCEPVNVTTPPAAPSDLEVTGVTRSEVSLAWTDNSNAEDGFKLQRRSGLGLANDYAEIAELGANVTSYIDTGVEQDHAYSYRLQAFKGEIETPWTDEVSAVTAVIPIDLLATPVSDSEIELSWTDVSSLETGYRLERKTAEADEWLVAGQVNADIVVYNDTGLDEATNYSYRAMTMLEEGESDPSQQAAATTMPKAPTNLTAVQDEGIPTTVNLSWTDVSSAESRYELQRKKEGEQYQAFANPPANMETYSDAGLAVNTIYTYRVRAASAGNNVSFWSNEAGASTSILSPDAPSDIVVDSISYSIVVLSWSDNSDDEAGFVLERSRERFQNYRTIDTTEVDQPTFIDTGLEPLTDYYYRVYAYNEHGNSPLSVILRVTTSEGPPTAPENLHTTVIRYGYVKLKWDITSDNEVGFKIERSYSPEGDWIEVVLTAAEMDSCVDASVIPLTTYYYRVYAFNYIGVSDYSNVIEVNTPLGPPNAPTNLDSVGATLISIEIRWNDNSDNETGFRVYRHMRATNWAPVAQIGTNITTFMDYDVAHSTTYFYIVTAFNEAGESRYSNELTVITPIPPPGTPFELTAEPVELTEIELTWVFDTDDESYFLIERRDSPDGAFDSAGTAPRRYYTYIDTGLVPNNHTYWYQVLAVNDGGCSDPSNMVDVQTPTLDPPTNVRAQATSATDMQVSWNPGPYHIDHFILESRDDPEGEFEQIADTDETYYLHTNLEPDEQQYWYRVKSFVREYESDWSDIALGITSIAFQDYFEDHEVDQPPGDPWEYENVDPSYAHITNEERHEGEKSLNFHDPQNNSGGYCAVRLEHVDVNVGSIDFWLKLSEGGTWGFDAYSTDAWNNGIEYICWLFPDSTITTNDGNSWATVEYIYIANEWFHIVFNHSADANTFSVTINDEVIYSDYGMVFGNPINHLRWICFSDVDMDDAWMDEVTVRHTVDDNERISSGPVRHAPGQPILWRNPNNLHSIDVQR